ncbi:hypothetical protein [Amycolatopsis magusensis]|uniref:hypothetical protein n=1 Tax=Amycolatopsis magusensis TaxID=882444 RepID=UPI0037BA5F18
MPPFGDIGGAMGEAFKIMMASAFDAVMDAIWQASLALLREAFKLADQFSVFTVDTRSGPIGVLWPMMLWISGVLALGLFFWQILSSSLRGGCGFLRLITGPAQYGIALAVSVGLVAGFLAAVDGLTRGILEVGLQSQNFSDALNHTSFADGAVDGVKAVVLGLCALVGVLPAAIGFCLEMVVREAGVYVTVAVIPIAAAGLLANTTATWFWSTCRVLLTCIVMKPALALTVVLGVSIAGDAQGISGLLAGFIVLLASLFAPFALYALFSFVDPSTDAGAGLREMLSGMGLESYGANNPAVRAGAAGSDSDGGGGDAQEDSNTARFDQALAALQAAHGAPATSSRNTDPDSASGSSGESADSSEDGDATASAGPAPQPHQFANRGRVVATGRYGSTSPGDDSEPPEPPDSGGGEPPQPLPGPRGSGGAGGAAASDAAAIL